MRAPFIYMLALATSRSLVKLVALRARAPTTTLRVRVVGVRMMSAFAGKVRKRTGMHRGREAGC